MGNPVGAIIASIYWPLVVALYLFISFVLGDWRFSWLIFMFAGIFYNTIQAFYTNIETNLLIVKQKSGTFVKTAVPLFLYFRLTKALNWITFNSSNC